MTKLSVNGGHVIVHNYFHQPRSQARTSVYRFLKIVTSVKTNATITIAMQTPRTKFKTPSIPLKM